MDELIKKYKYRYPELSSMFDSVVFIPLSLLKNYMYDKKIEYNEKEISELLLLDIITSIYFSDSVDKLFNGEIDELKIAYEENEQLYMESISRVDIIEGLTKLINSNSFYLTDNILKKYDMLKNKITYESLKDIKKDSYYKIEIDKQEYNISINDILLFMQMDSDRLKKICDDSAYKYIGKIKKEYFFYAAYKYFTANDILSRYLVSSEIKTNYESLKNLEMIDFEAVNKFYNYDNGVNRIKLNTELERAILKNMPKNYNKIQSAIYIYIKMCKLLSYDEEFFFAHQETDVLNKHKSIDHLLMVSPKANEVVCYEFNAIYAKLLKDFGVHFTPNKSIEECYGTNNHMMLDFRCGKYLVSADSLTSIFSGDIINVKLNQKIIGLVCENKNEKTQADFKKMLDNIYKTVNSEEEEKKYYIRDFDDSNVLDKLLIIFEKCNHRDLLGIDLISYILKLYKYLFNEKERTENIKISVVTGYKGMIHGGIVFCVNTNGFNVGEENTYYLVDTKRNIKILNRIEVQELFDNHIIDYYDELKHDLPGINKVLKR